jgi:LmbE family N-acetylglucosaminyl deacetylase
MPGTLVSFHAHPDDEAILTGGTIARAADEGHRVVLVFATRGELGEMLDGVSRTTSELGEHRSGEAERAAAALGVARVAFLEFHDSGMAATRRTTPTAFWSPTEEAPAPAALLVDEHAECSPPTTSAAGTSIDHIKVTTSGCAPPSSPDAQPVPRDDQPRHPRNVASTSGPRRRLNTGDRLGSTKSHHDVRRRHGPADRKRAAMAARQQIPDSSFFPACPTRVRRCSAPSGSSASAHPREPRRREDWIF